MFFSPAHRTPRGCFIEKCPLATEKGVKYLLPSPFLSHLLMLFFFNLLLYNSLKLCFFLHRNCRVNFLSLGLDSVCVYSHHKVLTAETTS